MAKKTVFQRLNAIFGPEGVRQQPQQQSNRYSINNDVLLKTIDHFHEIGGHGLLSILVRYAPNLLCTRDPASLRCDFRICSQQSLAI